VRKRGDKSAPKFVLAPTTRKKRNHSNQPKSTTNPKPSFNPKKKVRKETPKPREESLICMFSGCAGHLDEFCFRCKRIEKRRFDYARNSYRDEFFDFRLILTRMLHLALLLMLCLVSLMDLTITHMLLVHERSTL
jgi:hypothetical protein